MINPAIENDLKNMSLNDVNYADYIKENYVPIEVLQEIQQEIDEHREKLKLMADDDWYAGKIRGYDCAIEFIDKHISDIGGTE